LKNVLGEEADGRKDGELQWLRASSYITTDVVLAIVIVG
jgi:hypothetical protein